MFAAFLLCGTILPPHGEPDDKPPTPTQIVADKIHHTRQYTLRVSVPGGTEQVYPFRYEGDNDGATGNNWGGWRIVPSVIRSTTAADGKGLVILAFDFPGEKEPSVLRAKGPAEDVYLLRSLGIGWWARWFDDVVGLSKAVVTWPKGEGGPREEGLEKVPPELAAAVKLGKQAYEAKRPELIRRFSRSFLYYPAATEARWDVRSAKGTVWLDTGCHDRMYHARFRVELRQAADGSWDVIRILANEEFKGE